MIAFGDRIDHNVFGPTAGTPNGDLFLNILQVAATPQVGGAPTSMYRL
ncbi:MAG: hypothetical protein IPI73_06530 [Betaproteobacteria bacterium]|nr:hypothetical protein [Betaproteobacteria bacterium]